MAWLQYNEDLPSTDNENDSTTDTDTDSLFDSSNDNETDITSGTDTDSPSEINDNTDDNISLFNNKVRYPPEYYLIAVVNLNIEQLR
jgi:hypothetical protein